MAPNTSKNACRDAQAARYFYARENELLRPVYKAAVAVMDGFEVLDAQGPEFFDLIKSLRAAVEKAGAEEG